MRSSSFVIVMAIAASLSACGGGGSPGPDQQQAQAIKDGAGQIKPPVVPVAPFTGAFCAVNGVSIGYVEGKSEDAVAAALAQRYVDNLSLNTDNYRLLLSDSGLKIVVFGSIHQTPFGTVANDPDILYVAKLTTNGVVVKRG